jgi:hypothetical protein
MQSSVIVCDGIGSDIDQGKIYDPSFSNVGGEKAQTIGT